MYGVDIKLHVFLKYSTGLVQLSCDEILASKLR